MCSHRFRVHGGFGRGTRSKNHLRQSGCDRLARTIEIDTTGGPGFGFEHFRQHDFLRNKEVVLTFDDGPWPDNTPKVLEALANHCTKAIFFPIGKHASYYPEILKKVAEGGHSIGSHTWSHVDLSKKGMKPEDAKAEIEKGCERGEGRCRRPHRTVLPLPGSASSARTRDLYG